MFYYPGYVSCKTGCLARRQLGYAPQYTLAGWGDILPMQQQWVMVAIPPLPYHSARERIELTGMTGAEATTD